jgi:hypothetical protein
MNTMKTIIQFFLIVLILVDLSNRSAAQSPDWLWAKSAGGNLSDYANSIATDGNGNVYVTGYFSSDSITFGSTILVNANTTDSLPDMFVAKYDASGNVLWAKSYGGTSIDEGKSITTDKNGNVCVTGFFKSSSIIFGNDTLISDGSEFIFVVKYDASGNVLWAKRTGGNISNIAADSSGNIYIAGYFQYNTIIFGGDTLTSSGNIDIFLMKYDAFGNELWARNAGGASADWCYGIAIDDNSNAYLTGSFDSPSMIFGSDTLIKTGDIDIFILKYDSSGDALWAKGIGGTGINNYQWGQSITTDHSGNVYVLGNFFSGDTIILGNDTLFHPQGGYDIFVAKFDASGNEVWAKSAEGDNNDFGGGIVTDASGNVYITGWFESDILTFGTVTLTNSAGNLDAIFIAKYDASGTLSWAKSTRGLSSSLANSISVDSSDNVYITGRFNGFPNIIFGNDTLTDLGFGGIFVAKIASTVTGIQEISASKNDIVLYPNPVTNQLTVDNRQHAIKNVEIVNILGEKIFQSETINLSALRGSEIQIDVSAFVQGIYFCKVSADNRVEVMKFVKD